MADLEQQFQKAAESIKNLVRRPNDTELLEIYALFKQATVGDCNHAKPSMFQPKEQAKFDVWMKKKGRLTSGVGSYYINIASN